jgi:CRP-like cAMP-binding protein
MATPALLDLCIMAAMLLLATAFSAESRWWLHGLAVGASAAGLVCASLIGNSYLLLGAIVLLGINLGQLVRMRRRNRAGALTSEERALIAEVLSIEEPAKQRRLREVITWRDADTGEVLMRQGQKAPPLIYVATGQMEIEHEGLPVSTCGPDDFLGEMSLVTGEGATATVKVALPARIAVFDRGGLLRLMEAMPELSRAFDRRLNAGLVDKIQRMNRAMNGASVER